MNTGTPDQKNALFEEIIAARRSHRAFREEAPPEDAVTAIIHAGLLAPYAAAAVGSSTDYFRRFFVMPKGSRAMNAIRPLVMAEVEASGLRLGKAMEHDPRLQARATGFVRRLDLFRKSGMVPGVGTAPFYIVVAEKRGFPPVELQSLAHCLENMWLKATALGLGFQIVSITAQMADNPEFCSILGIPAGEWALMGCAVGYPREDLPHAIRPAVAEVTRWLD